MAKYVCDFETVKSTASKLDSYATTMEGELSSYVSNVNNTISNWSGIAKEKYVTSISAFEPSTLGAIPKSLVCELIDNNRQLAWFFIHELSKHLGNSDTKIVNLTQKHIRGRLAEALLMLVDNYGFEEDEQTIKIYMSREDIANLSNMTTSNAIRTLSTFVSEKLITVDGRRIKILNEAMLRKISKFG